VNRTKRSIKLLSAVAAVSLIVAACGDDDDDSATTVAPSASDEAADVEESVASEESTVDSEVMSEESTVDSEVMSEESTAESMAEETASGIDWSDPLVRQAVSMAIDRQAITDVIFQGARQPADDWWPATFVGYRGGDSCANLQYDPEAAKALWDEAGVPEGESVTFWFNSGAGHEEWIEAVSNQLKENLGIGEVSFESLEFADYLDKLDAAEVDGPFRLGWLMDYPSPGNFLGPLHGTAGSSNHTGYSNPDFDAAVAEGDSLPLDEAVPSYQAAADILCEDIPFAPMFFGLLQAVYSENVDNVSFDPFQALNVTEVTDVDGDGTVSVYVCEPQNGLYGQMTNETCGSEVVNGLFTGLWTLNSETGEVEFDKGMAESVETTDDGTNWTIKLKDGWTFHDGTPVTSKSFADAWNWAALGTNAAQNQYFISLLGIEGFDAMNPPDEDEDGEPDTEPATELTGLSTPDDLTIELTLDAPFPQLPLVMLYNAFNPLPEVFFDDPEAFGEAPVGNGPFMMDGTWEHDVQVATVAYPDYAGETPQVDSIVYRIYSDDATGYNDIRAGSLDVMDQVPTAELGNVAGEFGDRYIEEQTSSFNYLGFPIDLELAAEWAAGG